MKIIKKIAYEGLPYIRTTLERDCWYCTRCFMKKSINEYQTTVKFQKISKVCRACINKNQREAKKQKLEKDFNIKNEKL